MTTPSLAHTITMQHGPLTLDLQAEAPTQSATKTRLTRYMNSLVVRIALPPVAIWGTLYSVIEYIA